MHDPEAIKWHQKQCDETRNRLRAEGMVGRWSIETDRAEWKHAGLACMAIRNPSGFHWCGYVGVPPGHPFYGKSYNDVETDIDVHGGLTYSEQCGGHICHMPQPGETDNLWWFGFDCAHAGDLAPGYAVLRRRVGEAHKLPDYTGHDKYRDLQYVEEQTAALAMQLAHAVQTQTA